MFVVNAAFCVVASVLLALLFVEAESDIRHGHLLADTEIAVGRYTIAGPTHAATPARTSAPVR